MGLKFFVVPVLDSPVFMDELNSSKPKTTLNCKPPISANRQRRKEFFAAFCKAMFSPQSDIRNLPVVSSPPDPVSVEA